MNTQKDMSKAVCRCKKVFFEDLEKAVADGATTFEEVQEVTKVGKGCRRCVKNAQEITEHLLKNK